MPRGSPHHSLETSSRNRMSSSAFPVPLMPHQNRDHSTPPGGSEAGCIAGPAATLPGPPHSALPMPPLTQEIRTQTSQAQGLIVPWEPLSNPAGSTFRICLLPHNPLPICIPSISPPDCPVPALMPTSPLERPVQTCQVLGPSFVQIPP